MSTVAQNLHLAVLIFMVMDVLESQAIFYPLPAARSFHFGGQDL